MKTVVTTVDLNNFPPKHVVTFFDNGKETILYEGTDNLEAYRIYSEKQVELDDEIVKDMGRFEQ